MMILPHEQRSPEWFKARLGVITASNFAKVLSKGTTRRTYMLQLAAETLSDAQQPSFCNDAMQWGIDHEDEAANAYEFLTGNTVEPVSLCLLDHHNIGASPDGLVGDDGLIEIKCPNSTTHIEWAVAGKLPAKHKAQVQGQLWVTERAWCDFISYDPRLENSLFTVRVTRDDKYIETLNNACMEFLSELEQLIGQYRDAA